MEVKQALDYIRALVLIKGDDIHKEALNTLCDELLEGPSDIVDDSSKDKSKDKIVDSKNVDADLEFDCPICFNKGEIYVNHFVGWVKCRCRK